FLYLPQPRPQPLHSSPTRRSSDLARLFANDSTTNVIGTCAINVTAGPALSVNDVTVTEGNTGTTNAIFTVTLSPTAPGTVTVNFATADHTATAGSVCGANTGSASF